MIVASARLQRIAALFFAICALSPYALRAQSSASVTTHSDVTLNVPIQVKNFDSTISSILVHCTIQPSGAAAGVGAVPNDNTIQANLEHGGFSGTVQAHFTVVTQQTIAAQWTYSCKSELHREQNGQSEELTPGSASAPLTSGANLVTGTFAMR